MLEELRNRMAENAFVKDPRQLLELALQREAIVSTAVIMDWLSTCSRCGGRRFGNGGGH